MYKLRNQLIIKKNSSNKSKKQNAASAATTVDSTSVEISPNRGIRSSNKKNKSRTTHVLGLSDRFQIDAVLMPDLRLNLQSIEIPEEWKHLEDEIADQDTAGVHAVIVVGAEKAEIFPQPEHNKSGNPVQVGSYRLMRSKLTNRLIVSKACEVHGEPRDTTYNTHSCPSLSPARSGIEPVNVKQEPKLEKQ